MGKFNVGDVCRYSNGCTSLFQITYVSEKHNGRQDRYYGTQCLGGSVGSYESDTYAATKEDLKMWKAKEKDRNRK